MPSTRKSTSVMMTSPHFLIQGQSCFPDEQPGHGEPSHEESAGYSASHREIGRKGGWTYTVVSPWDLYVSCSGSSHFKFSLVLPILFLDTDFCGFTAKRRVLQYSYCAVSLHINERAMYRRHVHYWQWHYSDSLCEAESIKGIADKWSSCPRLVLPLEINYI